MKLLFCLLSLSLSSHWLFAQVPRFSRQPVMESGAALYFPAKPAWQHSLSEDSSDVYTTEYSADTVVFGAIIVRFHEPLIDDSATQTNLLLSYMKYLNESSFKFKETVSPGFGHKLASHPRAYGILQYGVMANKSEYSIKGWVNSRFLAILYVGYKNDYSFNVRQMYLDGFRFPEQ